VNTSERGYRRAYNQPFNGFPKNVGFNDGASAAQPDMVEGFDLMRFDLFPVREELGGAAVPSLGPNAITLPYLILLVMHTFILSLPAVLFLILMHTIRLNPKTKSNTINILRAPPY
jgi:hypothetical protein